MMSFHLLKILLLIYLKWWQSTSMENRTRLLRYWVSILGLIESEFFTRIDFFLFGVEWSVELRSLSVQLLQIIFMYIIKHLITFNINNHFLSFKVLINHSKPSVTPLLLIAMVGWTCHEWSFKSYRLRAAATSSAVFSHKSYLLANIKMGISESSHYLAYLHLVIYCVMFLLPALVWGYPLSQSHK